MTSPGRSFTGPGHSSVDADQLAALMRRVAGGDQGAFEVVYDVTSPMVYGTAVRVLRAPELAAEVTQEVFVEVWRIAAQFDAVRGSVTAWVATMAHRRAVDRVRSVQAERARDELDAAGSYRRPYDEVADAVERTEERDRVTDCLGSLTELQRDAVERAYYAGQTYREVAADSGISLPTAKSRIRDGLNRLRRCLEGER